MIDCTDRKIWVFREARSGSIAFTFWLADIVGKKEQLVNSKSDVINDPSLLLHTHNFELLKVLNRADKPIIFRCTRRDKTEQLLSRLAADVTGFLHIIDVTTTAEIDQFHETVLHSKIAVTEQQVNDFIEECKIIDDLWDLYSSRFDSQTIYYEDCDKSISLLHLAIDDIPYAYGENQYGECLPAYKKEMFTNIDEVQCWMTRYYD